MARDAITDQTIIDLLDQVEDQNEKSRLARLKDAIVANKNLILFLMETLSVILLKSQSSR